MDEEREPSRIDRWAGRTPIERAGAMLISIGAASFLYWLIFSTDYYSIYWRSDLASSLRDCMRCLVGRCLEDTSLIVAVRCLAAGAVLRFLTTPLLRWLRAGSSSQS